MRLLQFAAILFVLSTFSYGQHGGMHGGSGGFSRGGFAGGGFRGGSASPRFRSNGGPPGFRARVPMSHIGGGFRPVPPGRAFNRSRNGRFHDGRFHHHVIIVNRFFPFRRFPFVWGYPYLWPSIFDDWGNGYNYDSQQTGNYGALQPSCDGSGVCQYQPQPDHQEPQPDDQENPSAGEREQPPSSSLRAPDQEEQAPFQPSGAIVYKHGNILEYKWVTPKTAHGSR